MKRFIALPLGDFILSILALDLAFFVRLNSLQGTEGIFNLEAKFLIFGLVLIFSSLFLEMYNQEKISGRKEIIFKISIGILISFFFLSSLYYIIPLIKLGRGLLLIALFSFGLLQFLWHVSYRALKPRSFASRVIILGTGPLAQKIGKVVKSSNNHYFLAGYINLPSEPVCVSSESILLDGNGNELLDMVRNKKAHKIVVSLSERRGVVPLDGLLKCKFCGVEVIDAPSFYEEVTGKLLIDEITPSWFIFSDGFKMTPLKRFGKGMLDIFIASIGLMIFLPLFPIIALLIKIDSSGPVFFKQLRLGEGEKNFTLYKFRTMHRDAENEMGAVWAQENDSRVTRVGKILRIMRLDEIPQFYNVLRGDMSIIGPRPERPEFVAELKNLIPYYSERHFVKPGITGWAQICYPYGSSVEDAIEKLRYDLYYIKHISFSLDVMIIMETIRVMLFGKGAR
jgi:sugar transferase (PEP-CTERM system associated)